MHRKTVKFALVFLLIHVAITTGTQCYTKIYDFSPARPFSGDRIYDPYKDIDSTSWLKANFHAHQRWMLRGFDFEYTPEEFIDAYKQQGYDIVGLSDHHQINENGHIPSYEHGLGANNFHIMQMGTDNVMWFNYPIMSLPRHQTQTIVDMLKGNAKLMGINHPERHRFHSFDVFDNLMGYDVMEINPDHDCTAWDRALSNGIYSTIIANDDTHQISNRNRWFQKEFTMVNSPSKSADDIVASLKAGRAYAVAVSQEQNQKENPHLGLPTISDIKLEEQTIHISFSTPADSVVFVGQEGRTKAVITRANLSSWPIKGSNAAIGNGTTATGGGSAGSGSNSYGGAGSGSNSFGGAGSGSNSFGGAGSGSNSFGGAGPRTTIYGTAQIDTTKATPPRPKTTASYKFVQSDTYIRIEAYFDNGTEIWTSPYRRQGGAEREAPTVNRLLTGVNAIFWGVLTLGILYLIVRIIRKRKVDRDCYYQ